MEDAGLKKKLKKRTTRTTASAEKMTSAPTPKPTRKKKPATAEAVAPEQVQEAPSETVEAPAKLAKGFTVGLQEDGVIRIDPFGDLNRLELVGLNQYVGVKLEDVLNQIGNTIPVSRLNTLTKGMQSVATGLNVLLADRVKENAAQG